MFDELTRVREETTVAQPLNTEFERIYQESCSVCHGDDGKGGSRALHASFDLEGPGVTSVADVGDYWDTALLDLQSRELIRETGRFPVRSFIFKNAMTQEAAS